MCYTHKRSLSIRHRKEQTISCAATCAADDFIQTNVDAERWPEFSGLLDFQVAMELDPELGIHVQAIRDPQNI